MADNIPAIRYATNTWDVTGAEQSFEINFSGGYIRQSDVLAFSVVIDPETQLASDTQIHVVTFPDPEGQPAMINVTPQVAAGRRLVVYRSTEKQYPLVNYVNGSVLTKANLDLANKQAIFGLAEIMDGLSDARIVLDRQTGEIIDQNILIREIYEEVLRLLASGGIISAAPRVWMWSTEEGTLDYPMPGADVDGAGMYDTYMAGLGLIPDTDYTVDLVDNDPTQSMLRLMVDPPDGAVLFTVLRGFAQPYQGAPPATVADLRTPIIPVTTTNYFPTLSADRGVLWYTVDDPARVTVREAAEAGAPATKLYTGSYYSVLQGGVGQVTVEHDPSVTLVVPAGYVAKTRATGATITLTCLDGDTNTWLVSGDLART